MFWFADIPGRIFLVAALAPLAVAVLLFLAGTVQRLRKVTPGPGAIAAGWLAVLTMAFAAACSIIGTLWLMEDYNARGDQPKLIESRWSERVEVMRIGSKFADSRPALAVSFGFQIDRLTALMMTMVTVIGTLIFLFSLGYMKEELKEVHDHAAHVHRRGRFARFFFYMLLFAFSMLHLLVADNLLQVFISWELVGVSSFLLIGFYYERRSASTAANKAFVMNRVGDAGFLIGLAILWTHFGTFGFNELNVAFMNNGGGLSHTLWVVMGLGLFAGCVGKSAQFPLQTWLPDAMEGPTPVSALIHAATMVAAGVYLCARCLPYFAPEVMTVVAWCGAITLLISAATACVQTDIKRVLAFSTCSQLGYMMLALGLADWTAGLFHLLTHAFFKALLFLGAGSVIAALHHEQDLLKMGGLRKKLPVTAYTMLIGVMAIIGVPLFSGWYSKDLILARVYEHHDWAFIAIAFGTVILTAYYMTRLWLMAFAGTPRDEHVHNHAHESPAVMTLPLIVLAVFSVGVAWGSPIWDAHASKLGHILHDGEPVIRDTRVIIPMHDRESLSDSDTAMMLGLACAIVGVAIAIFRHRAGQFTTAKASALSDVLRNRFYFDTLYDAIFTKPTVVTARAVGAFDKNGARSVSERESSEPRSRFGLQPDYSLDGAFTGAGTLVVATGQRLAPLQTGRLRGYVTLLGLTVVMGLAILWIIR